MIFKTDDYLLKNYTNSYYKICTICILIFIFSSVIIYLQDKGREENKNERNL